MIGRLESTPLPDTSVTLEQAIAAAQERLAEGDRSGALEVARRTVERFPDAAISYRVLSLVLTNEDLYRYDTRVCRKLVAEGAIAEALALSQKAALLVGANDEDFLQAGYCLTALGRYGEAAIQIRRATDIWCLYQKPGLFTGISESWTPLSPRFLIVGAKKGGTSSLHYYLSRHPRVLLPIMKEIHFFGSPERGEDWYLAHFPRRPPWGVRFIAGESRVDNFAEEGIPESVKARLPAARLIAVLRDPVERAISHYYHDRKVGGESRPLDVAFEEELESLGNSYEEMDGRLQKYLQSQRRYLYFGLYAHHVARWLSVFPPEQFLMVISEELLANPERELKKVLKHIGIKNLSLGEYINTLPGTYDNQSRGKVKARLAEFYAKQNEKLFFMIGRRLNWQGVG